MKTNHVIVGYLIKLRRTLCYPFPIYLKQCYETWILDGTDNKDNIAGRYAGYNANILTPIGSEFLITDTPNHQSHQTNPFAVLLDSDNATANNVVITRVDTEKEHFFSQAFGSDKLPVRSAFPLVNHTKPNLYAHITAHHERGFVIIGGGELIPGGGGTLWPANVAHYSPNEDHGTQRAYTAQI